MPNLLKIFSFLILFQCLLFIFFDHFAKFIKLVDIPTNRKTHVGEIPLIGGIVIFITIFASLFLFNYPDEVLVIFFSSSIILIVGVIDDKFNISILPRFFFQIISCLIVIGYGIAITNLEYVYYNYYLNLYGFSVLFTFVSVIGFTNAINFIDGLDGLASGVLLNSLFAMILYSYFGDNFNNVEIIIVLILTLLIFLLSNFSIILKKSFLGDSGSTFLGFFISFLIIFYTQGEEQNFHPFLAIWCVAYPIYDLIAVFIRRIYKGINPFMPDKRHFHFLLIDKGYSNKFSSFLIVLSSFALSIIGLIAFQIGGPILSFVVFLIIFLLFFYASIYLSRI